MDMNVVKEIARLLKIKKDSNNKAVLVLGARAGRFFSNQELYQTILGWSTRISTFESLSEVEKFHECYQVLSLQTEPTVNDFLVRSLKKAGSGYRQEDMYLVNLVKEKYFDVIISTNIDGFVESAFEHEGLREPHDYQMFNPEVHTIKSDMQQRPEYCTLVKVFGDFGSRQYTANLKERERNLDSREMGEFKAFLGDTLARSILVVGYDPLWDRALERIFPLQNGEFWYVSEKLPPEHSLLARVIERRKGNYLQESYSSFFQALHAELLDRELRNVEICKQIQEVDDAINSRADSQERASANTAQAYSDLQSQSPQELLERIHFPIKLKDIPEVVAPSIKQDEGLNSNSSTTKSEKEKRKRVFISYSHKDARYRERLHKFLTIYERNGLLDVWDDKKITAGEDWREEIKKALEEAKVAVLLVSQDFLASKFIAEDELPPLFAAARAGGTRIIPIILNYCTFDDSPLHRFQSVNSPSKPLTTMRTHERDAIWVQVAKLIRDA